MGLRNGNLLTPKVDIDVVLGSDLDDGKHKRLLIQTPITITNDDRLLASVFGHGSTFRNIRQLRVRNTFDLLNIIT